METSFKQATQEVHNRKAQTVRGGMIKRTELRMTSIKWCEIRPGRGNITHGLHTVIYLLKLLIFLNYHIVGGVWILIEPMFSCQIYVHSTKFDPGDQRSVYLNQD